MYSFAPIPGSRKSGDPHSNRSSQLGDSQNGAPTTITRRHAPHPPAIIFGLMIRSTQRSYSGDARLCKRRSSSARTEEPKKRNECLESRKTEARRRLYAFFAAAPSEERLSHTNFWRFTPLPSSIWARRNLPPIRRAACRRRVRSAIPGRTPTAAARVYTATATITIARSVSLICGNALWGTLSADTVPSACFSSLNWSGRLKISLFSF